MLNSGSRNIAANCPYGKLMPLFIQPETDLVSFNFRASDPTMARQPELQAMIGYKKEIEWRGYLGNFIRNFRYILNAKPRPTTPWDATQLLNNFNALVAEITESLKSTQTHDRLVREFGERAENLIPAEYPSQQTPEENTEIITIDSVITNLETQMTINQAAIENLETLVVAEKERLKQLAATEGYPSREELYSDHMPQIVQLQLPTEGQSFTIMSWNVCLEGPFVCLNPYQPTGAVSESVEARTRRAERVLQRIDLTIEQQRLSFIALQEVDSSAQLQIQESFERKGWVVVKHILESGATLPICSCYDPKVFELIESSGGLSTTLDQSLSTKLRHRVTGDIIKLNNVHLKYTHQVKQSEEKIAQFLPSLDPNTTLELTCGDFNVNFKSTRTELRHCGDSVDAQNSNGPTFSSSDGFVMRNPNDSQKILQLEGSVINPATGQLIEPIQVTLENAETNQEFKEPVFAENHSIRMNADTMRPWGVLTQDLKLLFALDSQATTSLSLEKNLYNLGRIVIKSNKPLKYLDDQNIEHTEQTNDGKISYTYHILTSNTVVLANLEKRINNMPQGIFRNEWLKTDPTLPSLVNRLLAVYTDFKTSILDLPKQERNRLNFTCLSIITKLLATEENLEHSHAFALVQARIASKDLFQGDNAIMLGNDALSKCLEKYTDEEIQTYIASKEAAPAPEPAPAEAQKPTWPPFEKLKKQKLEKFNLDDLRWYNNLTAEQKTTYKTLTTEQRHTLADFSCDKTNQINPRIINKEAITELEQLQKIITKINDTKFWKDKSRTGITGIKKMQALLEDKHIALMDKKAVSQLFKKLKNIAEERLGHSPGFFGIGKRNPVTDEFYKLLRDLGKPGINKRIQEYLNLPQQTTPAPQQTTPTPSPN